MVDQMTLQTIGILLTAVTVSIAAIYYTLTLRYTRRNQELTLKAQEQALETRQAQLFMSIYSTYSSAEFHKAYREILNCQWKDYDDFQSKYGFEVNPDADAKGRMINAYFEGVGVLMKRGLIDPSIVDDLISGVIIRYWEKYEPYILEYRKRRDWPQAGEHVEYLYNKIKPIASKQREELQKDTP
jgi:hypothetical protein